MFREYRIERDLPLYPAGTIILHTFEEKPSRYGKGRTYFTEGEWHVKGEEVHCASFIPSLISFSRRIPEWVTLISENDEGAP